MIIGNVYFPEDEEESIVELTDDTDQTVQFQHLATVQHEDQEYLVLTEYSGEEEDEDEEGEDEVTILQIKQDENGEDYYEELDDEELFEAVFAEFMEAVQQLDELPEEE